VSGPVLVVGGAGFIGSHLVERLVADGRPVHVVDDLSRGRRDWLPDGVGLDVLDVRDARGLADLVGRVRPVAVVHLAAMHFIPDVDGAPELARDVNVGGTSALLDAHVTSPPERLLFASTAAVYPDRAGPISEACVPAPFDVYGTTKLEGERLVEGFASATGATVVLARNFNVIGRRETNAHVVPDLVGQLRRHESPVRLGNLTPKRDYTDVRDTGDALAELLAVPTPSVQHVNVGSGRGVSVTELVAACERVLGHQIDVEVDPGRTRPVDRQELVADNMLLRRLTGWSPTRSIDQTLAELVETPDS
jgi:UDP-glucose 4-epimerase